MMDFYPTTTTTVAAKGNNNNNNNSNDGTHIRNDWMISPLRCYSGRKRRCRFMHPLRDWNRVNRVKVRDGVSHNNRDGDGDKAGVTKDLRGDRFPTRCGDASLRGTFRAGCERRHII